MINNPRKFAITWLLEPIKSREKITFIINPRTDVTIYKPSSTSKDQYYIKVPLEDYDADNNIKYTSTDSKYKIIDSNGNEYKADGSITTEGETAVYTSYVTFTLKPGTYFYYEMESGVGKNLISNPVEIVVKNGMAKVINVDHVANEFKLYLCKVYFFATYRNYTFIEINR